MVTFPELGNIAKWGRLGNQLFQVASTVGIALKNKQGRGFPKWKYNEYFENRIPEFEIDVNKSNAWYKIQEDNTSYKEFNLNLDFNYMVYGYLQSYLYFEHCKDYIKWMFSLPKIELPTNLCSIHVRRGDYLERSNFHTNLTIDYYKEATSYFKEDVTYFIMSDDIPWCENNFGFLKHKWFSSNRNEIDDLRVMIGCDAHIIANSSFSWWGAYLASIPGKVIAPKNWWVTLNSDDICPPDWIRI